LAERPWTARAPGAARGAGFSLERRSSLAGGVARAAAAGAAAGRALARRHSFSPGALQVDETGARGPSAPRR